MFKYRIVACLVFAGAALLWAGTDFGATVAEGGKGGKYPHYSKWYHNTDHNYHYTNYTYGPGQDSYHRVYYYPKTHYPQYYGGRRHVYYYNWSQKRYWGRMDLDTGKYSLLPEGKRKEKLTDIAEKDFPEPVARETIVIPGTEDLKMTELPPPLPTDEKK